MLTGTGFTVLIGSLLVSYAAIALEFVATTNPMFFGGKFLNGFATGIMMSVSMTYVSEVSPPIANTP